MMKLSIFDTPLILNIFEIIQLGKKNSAIILASNFVMETVETKYSIGIPF